MSWKKLADIRILFVLLATFELVTTPSSSASTDRCNLLLVDRNAVKIAAEAGHYTVDGNPAPRSGWGRYLDKEIVNVSYYGPMPTYEVLGVVPQKIVSESDTSPSSRKMIGTIRDQAYEVGFWEIHVSSGETYLSEFFSSQSRYSIEIQDGMNALNSLLRSEHINLKDLVSVNVFHNHPDGRDINAPLSIGDRQAIFEVTKMIEKNASYRFGTQDVPVVGIYAVSPSAPGILFYSNSTFGPQK